VGAVEGVSYLQEEMFVADGANELETNGQAGS